MNGDTIKLKIEDISLSFRGVQALIDVSFEVKKGEILAIIGPNGAGKTCVLNCINGFYRSQKGRIYFEGRDITTLPTHLIAALGIGRTFQNIGLFEGMSTLDNLMAARCMHYRVNIATAALYFGKAQQEDIKHREAVEKIIDFLEIEHVRKAFVGTLPYGLRKRVELGRALALEPTLLILDEPMAGMNEEEKGDIARFILDIYEEREITIVLIEHHMRLVMEIADRIAVLDFGRKIADGRPEEVRSDPRVIKAYLGE